MQPSSHFLTALSKHLLNTLASVSDGTFLRYRPPRHRGDADGRRGGRANTRKEKPAQFASSLLKSLTKGSKRSRRGGGGGGVVPSDRNIYPPPASTIAVVSVAQTIPPSRLMDRSQKSIVRNLRRKLFGSSSHIIIIGRGRGGRMPTRFSAQHASLEKFWKEKKRSGSRL